MKKIISVLVLAIVSVHVYGIYSVTDIDIKSPNNADSNVIGHRVTQQGNFVLITKN